MANENGVIANMSDKKILKLYQKNRNTFMIISFILIIGLYIFFFMSPTIFRVPAETMYTSLGVEESFGSGRTVKIISWNYSPSQELMEIQLELSDAYGDTKSGYSFSSFVNYAVESKGATQLPIEKKMEQYNLVVIWLHNVPEDFNTCSLNIYPPEGDDDIGELYTNSDRVKKVKSINAKSEAQYRIEVIKINIKALEKSIKSNETKINRIYKEIRANNVLIQEIRDNEKYQSEDEIRNSEETIKEYQNDNKKKQSDISLYRSKNSDNKYDIQEYKKLIEKIKKE